MVSRPAADEYNPFYAGYISFVPENSDIFAVLQHQADALRDLLRGVTDDSASVRPAPDEWSVKEVIGHITDTERVFAYRALRIARGDTIPLAGFNQDAFVQQTNFNARSLANLLDEFDFLRRSNVLLLESLTEAELQRRGTASDFPISVRALVYIIGGHVNHHLESLKTDYHIDG